MFTSLLGLGFNFSLVVQAVLDFEHLIYLGIKLGTQGHVKFSWAKEVLSRISSRNL